MSKTRLVRADKNLLEKIDNIIPGELSWHEKTRKFNKMIDELIYGYKNKKGSIQDLMYLAIILLVVSVVTLIGFKISNELNTEFQASDLLAQGQKDAYNTINNIYTGTFDNMFLVLVVGLGVSALVMASLVRFHPVFFVFFILVMAIMLFMCGVFSNIYLEMANDPDMSTEADQLTYITFVMGKLPFIVGVLGTLLAIVMYKSWQNA